ncbi:MAG: polysaccharide deacetylase family protein [Culicoidibacterales bacterium]
MKRTNQTIQYYLVWGIVIVSMLLLMSSFSIGTMYFGSQAVAKYVAQVHDLEQQVNQLTQALEKQQSQPPLTRPFQQKMAFLTFDDGPSTKTMEILAILQAYNVKATFYVTGQKAETYPEVMEKIISLGHSVAAHSYSHRYGEIYSSLAAFQADFAKANSAIKRYTGKDVTLFRHPGGSSATAGTPGVVEETLTWLQTIGVNYTDWNVDSMDASSQTVTSQYISEQTLFQTANQAEYAVILLHDTDLKEATIAALPTIIEGLQAQGFQLDVIPEHLPLAQHRTP